MSRHAPPDCPTPRQIEILALVAEGLSNYEIGRRLWIEEETVKFHVANTLQRIGAKNRTHAVALGYQRGYLTTVSQLERIS